MSSSNGKTRITPPRKLSTVELPNLRQLYVKQDDVVVFSILGDDNLLKIHFTQNRMSIGRFSLGYTPPDIDLGEYGADILGVSRLHAIITQAENTYLIEDLGSTNGTVLNQETLVPHQQYELHNGDTLAFGQMVLVVYFASKQKIPTQQHVTQNHT